MSSSTLENLVVDSFNFQFSTSSFRTFSSLTWTIAANLVQASGSSSLQLMVMLCSFHYHQLLEPSLSIVLPSKLCCKLPICKLLYRALLCRGARHRENHAHPTCLHTSSIVVVLTSSYPFWVICRTVKNPFSIFFTSTALLNEYAVSPHSPSRPLHACLCSLLLVLLSFHEGISYPSVRECLRSHLLFSACNMPERPVTLCLSDAVYCVVLSSSEACPHLSMRVAAHYCFFPSRQSCMLARCLS